MSTNDTLSGKVKTFIAAHRGIAVAGGIISAMLALYACTTLTEEDKPEKASKLAQVPAKTGDSAGDGQTAEYRKRVDAWEKDLREQASKNGKTEIPSVRRNEASENTFEPTPITPQLATKAAPPPAPTPNIRKETTATSTKAVTPTAYANPTPSIENEPNVDTREREASRQEPSSEDVKRKLKAMTEIVNDIKSDKPASHDYKDTRFAAEKATPQTALASKDVVSAGETYLAEMITSVNSDQPGPVVSNILNGPFKGGRMVGRFTRQNDSLLIQFNTLSLNSQTISIEAYAVDPSTYGTGMATDVDHHTLSRHAALIGSAFLEGLREITLASGTRRTTVFSEEETKTFDADDRLAVGLGKVGDRLAPRAERYYDTPPTVTVAGGTQFGLLFTQSVNEKDAPNSVASSN